MYALLFAYLIIAIIGGYIVWHTQFDSLVTEQKKQLERLSEYIDSQLNKYRHIPELISKDAQLIDALYRSNNGAQIDITNRYLSHVNEVISGADTYLLNNEGTTIASSNWSMKKSFIGRNFSFRPYFQQAILGVKSEYFALGSTSGTRGYYYGFPVVHAAEVIGVVVVKMDLSSIEANWANKNSLFVATDSDGVIFMSSRSDWLLKSLIPLSQQTLERITAGQQYLSTDITSVDLTGDLALSPSSLSLNQVFFDDQYVTQFAPIFGTQLTLRVLSSYSALLWSLVYFLILLTLLFGFVYVLFLLTHHRQIKHQQIQRIQAEAKQKLEFQVLKRTAELQVEIKQRMETEQQLRQTQDELIQAAKLALLGKLSTSISHELNNPLAAIRSYADNGFKYLRKDNTTQASENFLRISQLTERMANISQQLRSFAKKTSADNLSVSSLSNIIQSSITLLTPELNKHHIHLEQSNTTTELCVLVNPIQIEQVIVNLITNAMHAVKDVSGPIVRVTVEQAKSHVSIHIDDNGSGISKVEKEQLFEPFFTTKDNGLGLGLSISKQIIHSCHGQLTANKSPLGGARFTITFKQ